jgi:hypothetical protein
MNNLSDYTTRRLSAVSPRKPPEDTMTYQISIPFQDAEPMFGTAYPKLMLTPKQKSEVLNVVLCEHCSGGRAAKVEYDKKASVYQVNTFSSGRASYDITVKMEEYFSTVWRNPIKDGLTYLFGWVNIYTPRPQSNYLLTTDIYADVVAWLNANVRTRDYKIYSKFGSDVSLGFRDPEHAVMFKLVFGDNDI